MKTVNDYSRAGRRIEFSDGELLFSPGQVSSGFVIVNHGAVRVEQTNSAGRTVVLYRVGAGESCVLTTTCLLSGHPYSGFGYAEGSVQGALISRARFRQLMQTDTAFQSIVFQSVAERVGELTSVIDDLLEHRTDLRLARWLAARPVQSIEMTQADIAMELGTAREVVSRALKVFESRGWISVSRGSIVIADKTALDEHSSSESM